MHEAPLLGHHFAASEFQPTLPFDIGEDRVQDIVFLDELPQSFHPVTSFSELYQGHYCARFPSCFDLPSAAQSVFDRLNGFPYMHKQWFAFASETLGTPQENIHGQKQRR